MKPRIKSMLCWSAALLLPAASLLALLSHWDYDTFVPTENTIVFSIPEFGGKGLTLTGIYGSTDVHCFIYHIEAGDADVDATVRQALSEAGFKSYRGDVLFRKRGNPPLEPEAVEVVRVSDPRGEGLVLAFFHQDDLPGGWNGEISERLWNRGWARSSLWARYEELVRQLENGSGNLRE